MTDQKHFLFYTFSFFLKSTPQVLPIKTYTKKQKAGTLVNPQGGVKEHLQQSEAFFLKLTWKCVWLL